MILFPIITSLISIVFALVLIYFIKKYPTGAGKQIEIWQAIKKSERFRLAMASSSATEPTLLSVQ